MDEEIDHAARCQFIPYPDGVIIATCPAKVGAVQVDTGNPYLGIGAVVIIVLAIAFGLKLIRGNKGTPVI